MKVNGIEFKNDGTCCACGAIVSKDKVAHAATHERLIKSNNYRGHLRKAKGHGKAQSHSGGGKSRRRIVNLDF